MFRVQLEENILETGLVDFKIDTHVSLLNQSQVIPIGIEKNQKKLREI
jgi:hypothetical protein